ncbi:hypothetical protein [Thermoactinomyces mirandus]|uniref:Uncharacterized protein n=1 Tax=Thermoactinomyces mirandus TaxID=2756294 RepID=A0A7W1XQH8_9BACL|nr:hypothetical protein [Thermoactinomyces mirandus]MBA4601286.1 hypothetical protein [Thermoactinomyces mirandus]
MKIKNTKRTIALIILSMIFMMLFFPFFPFLLKAQATPDPVLPDFKAPTTDPVLPDYKAPTTDPVLPDYKTPQNGSVKPDEGNQQGKQHPWLDTEDAWWKITKFTLKDIALDWTGAIEPFTGDNPIDDIAVAGKSSYNILKSPRGIIGAFFGDGSPPKIIIDAWDATDKTIDSINILRDVKTVKNLDEVVATSDNLTDIANVQKTLNTMKTVSRLSKGVAIGGMAVSAADMSINIYKAINSTGDDRADNIIKAFGSLGEGMVSASALAGPTPFGAFLLIGGAALWGFSSLYILYINVGGTKAFKNAGKAVADGAKKVWNKVTSWF